MDKTDKEDSEHTMEGTDGTEGESCSVTSEPVPEDMPTNSPCPSCEDPVLSDGQSSIDEMWCNSQSSAIENRCKEFTSNSAEDPPQLLCQLCEEDPPRAAVKTCTVCAVRYCEPCLAVTHPPRPPFSEHKLINPRPSFKKTVMCPDHPSKPVEMYCVQDQTPVCLLCEKVGRHKQHSMAALEEVFSQRRAEVQAWVDRMGAWLTHGEDKVRRLQEKQENVKSSAAELKSRIEKECDDLVDRISKRNTEMDRQVAEASNADTANLARLIRDVQDNIPKAHASLSKAEDLLHETDHANFLQSSVSVMAEIHRMVPIVGMDIENVSCSIDKLTVDFSQQKQVVENINIYKRYIPTMFPSPHGFPRAMSPYMQQHAPLATAGFPVVHGPPFHAYPSASAPGFNTVPAVQCTCPPQGHQGTFKIRQPPSQVQGQPVSSLAHGGYLQNVPVATCPPFVGAAPSAQQPVSTCPPVVSGAPPSGQQQVATCPPFIGAPPSAQQPPVQPTILHDLCSASMEEVNIVWQAVYNADEYQIRYTLEDRQVAAVVHACSFTATHLKPATVYRFEIRARNVAGSSQPSVTCLATEGKGFKFRFDPKTAGRFLAFSSQNTRVTVANPGDKPSGSPARFTDGNTVLGDKQVTSGRQYWEVSTGGAGSHYAVGVAYASMPRDRDIRDTTKSWAFVQHEKTQTFHHNEVTIFRTEADNVPSKIGVLLDYDAGQISVHDADRGTVIYTHKTTFTDPVYPAFSLWQGSLQLYTGLEKQQSFTQFAEKEEEPLTATILATLPPQEQKQMLGERIFPIVQVSHPKLAGKITGMLLEIDNDELLKMLDNREDLNAKVDEAVAVLSVHKASLKEKRIGEPSENGK